MWGPLWGHLSQCISAQHVALLGFEQRELPAILLRYFLWSNESTINQSDWCATCCATWSSMDALICHSVAARSCNYEERNGCPNAVAASNCSGLKRNRCKDAVAADMDQLQLLEVQWIQRYCCSKQLQLLGAQRILRHPLGQKLKCISCHCPHTHTHTNTDM